jgi:hypothetical protein
MTHVVLTKEQVRGVVDSCKFDNWVLELGSDDGRLYIQVGDPNGTDNITGESLPWKSRKWFVSAHMCVSEIVRTCYKCVQTAMLHELDEKFSYRGVLIYDPHRNLDLLVEAALSDVALDTREDPNTKV